MLMQLVLIFKSSWHIYKQIRTQHLFLLTAFAAVRRGHLEEKGFLCRLVPLKLAAGLHQSAQNG
jgi:hypothetical protein